MAAAAGEGQRPAQGRAGQACSPRGLGGRKMVFGHRVVPGSLSLWLSRLKPGWRSARLPSGCRRADPTCATARAPGRRGRGRTSHSDLPALRLEESLTMGYALGHAGVRWCECACVPRVCTCACAGWLPAVPAAPALPPRGFPGGAAAAEAGDPSAQPRRGAKPIAKNTYYTATFCK